MTVPARMIEPAKRLAANTGTPLGSAAWLRAGDGAVRGFQHGDFLLGYRADGGAYGIADDAHVLLAAGTRGGKGVSVITQNLILWKGSVLVVDPKGENAMLTARRRGMGSKFASWMGQTVWILDPFDTVRTRFDDFSDVKARFNPLDVLRPERDESVDDAGRIAEALIVGEASSDPFWDESARGLLKGLMLHVVTSADFAEGARNLNSVRALIMEGYAKAHELAVCAHGKKAASAFQLLFAAMKKNRAFDGVISGVGAMLEDLERTAPRTLGGIMQTARTNTEFLDSPAMKRCVAASDFSLRALKTDPKGFSLYVCLPQRFIETHYRWLRMILTLGVTELEQTRTMPASGHRVLMVLDEFPALRRMRVIENAAAQIAGFGVKLMFVVQTLAQLKELYKDNWETLLANAGTKIFFCNDDHFTREYVSKLVGDCEVVRTTHNASNTYGESETVTAGVTVGSSQSSTSGTSSGKGMIAANFSSSTTAGASQSSSQSLARGKSWSVTNGTSEALHRRALITPDEVGRLFGDRSNPTALTLISGHQPLFMHRQFYYQLLDLAGFYDPHPDHPLPLTIVEANDARDRRARRMMEARRRADAEKQERERAADAKFQRELHEAVLRKRARDEREVLRLEAERQAKTRKRAARRFAVALAVLLVCALAAWWRL